MCIPTCAHPDGPPCYKVPQSLASSPLGPNETVPTTLSNSKVITSTHICNGCELYSERYDQSRDEDADLTPDQTTLRREKSRVAAKLRRQKENQALVKLRLALPIQPSKLPQIGTVKGVSPLGDPALHDSNQQQQPIQQRRQQKQQQDPVQCRVLTECALSCVPNYRAANSISRQHHLAAPEFEKAVTVRLAGNALCLYDWLYTSPSQTNLITPDRELSVTRRNHSGCSWCYSRLSESGYSNSVPSLSLFSQSLMAIVVDTTENTVVYAPPSYAQLIGISWNTVIGLHLYEIRSKQFSSSVSAQLVHSQLTKPRAQDAANQISKVKLRPQQEASPNSFSSDTVPSLSGQPDSTVSRSTDSASPQSRSRPRSRKPSNGSLKRISKTSLQLIPQPVFCAELWTRTDTDTSSFAALTTLLPPGPNVAHLLGHLLLDDAETQGTAADSAGSSDGGEPLQTNQQLPTTPIVRQSFSEGPELFAVCWATMPLTPHARPGPSVLEQRTLQLKQDDRSTSTSTTCCSSTTSTTTTTRSSTTSSSNYLCSSSALRVCLLNPVSLHTGVGVDPDGSLRTGYSYSPTSGVIEMPPSFSTVTSRCGLTTLDCALRTYHTRTLRFLSVPSKWLTALDHTREKIMNCNLLDLIHPDDLDAISLAFSSITETSPIITSFYRIRHGSGCYRWCRSFSMLAAQCSTTDRNQQYSDCEGASQPFSSCHDTADPATSSSISSPSSSLSGGVSPTDLNKINDQPGVESETSPATFVCWYQFAHFHNSGTPDTSNSDPIKHPDKFRLRIPCRLSLDDNLCSSPANQSSHHLELFLSPGCDPRRSCSDSFRLHEAWTANTAHREPYCQNCARSKQKRRVASATNSYPSDCPDTMEFGLHTLNNHRLLDCCQSHRSCVPEKSPCSLYTSKSATLSTISKTPCVTHNTLSAYDALDTDVWDADGVEPFEDSTIDVHATPGPADSRDPNVITIYPPPSDYSANSSSFLRQPITESNTQWHNGVVSGIVKSMVSQTALKNEMDWARQAPSLNPDFGEFGITDDSAVFFPRHRVENSEPGSTDAENFLTPRLDPGDQTTSAPGEFCSVSVAVHPTWNTAASFEEDDVTKLLYPGESNSTSVLTRPCWSDQLSSQDSCLLPQAEIYAVTPGCCTFNKSDSSDDGVLTKRRRYAVHQYDDVDFPTTTAPRSLTEFQRLPESHGIYPDPVLSPLPLVSPSDFGLPTTCTSDSLQSSITVSTSVDSVCSRLFYPSYGRFPTLRRLLDTQVTDDYSYSSQSMSS